MSEPSIIINGQKLTPAQAMAVRVAITSYHAEMHQPDALGDDEHGQAMAKAYAARLGEVLMIALNLPQD